MPVTVEEKAIGRRTTFRRAERTYAIKGATTEGDAIAALVAWLAANVPTLNGLPLSANDCSAEEFAPDFYSGIGVWTNGSLDTLPPASFQISFDIAGQNTRITQSKQTMGRYSAAGVTNRDFGGAINVSADGSVEGCDIIIPFLCYTVNYVFQDADVTTGFVDLLATIVGTVNNAAFRGYQAGELLLTRVTGSPRADGHWDISFGFAVSRNKTGLTLGGITDITKDGWDYLWVFYVDTKDGSYVHKKPGQVNVERVFDRSNYALLQIGT